MGAEEQTSPKPSKATSSPQDTQTTMASCPQWVNPVQAYYGTSAATPYLASTVASSTPHPAYMWPQPMMPQYGTPVHFPAMYSQTGVYPPNIGMTPNIASAAQAEGKNSDIKDQNSEKKSKRTSSVGNEKTANCAETGKATSGSANDGASQSGDSGSEGSSNATDDNNKKLDHSMSKKGSFDLMLEDGANAQSGEANLSPMGLVPGNPVAMPATNHNIGMDLWIGSAAGAASLGPSTEVSSAVVPAMVMGELCYDERELKKQKRKQSNRESARRSRLRKQAECEELQRKVDSLSNENGTLKEELLRLAEECQKLTSENKSIEDELTRVFGPNIIRDMDASGEGNS